MFLLSIVRRLEEQRSRLLQASPHESLRWLRSELLELEADAELKGMTALTRPLRRMYVLTDLAEILSTEDPGQAERVVSLAAEGLGRIAAELVTPGSPAGLSWIEHESDRLWGTYVDLLKPVQPAREGEPHRSNYEDLDAPPQIDKALLIRLLCRGGTLASESTRSRSLFENEEEDLQPELSPAQLLRFLVGKREAVTEEERPAVPSESAIAQPRPPLEASPDPQSSDSNEAAPIVEPGEGFRLGAPIPDLQDGPLADPETRRAFREDAETLIERIGTLLSQLERGEHVASASHELGHSLHTLKGAMGAVGLVRLAESVHHLEDLNQSAMNTMRGVHPGLLLGLHDLLLHAEQVVAHLSDSPASHLEPSSDRSDAPVGEGYSPDASGNFSPRVVLGETHSGDLDETVRVPITRLGELMDLVAELLVLNGPRLDLASRVKQFSSAVRSSRNRLASSVDRLCEIRSSRGLELNGFEAPLGDQSDADQEFHGLVHHFTEQSDDLLILAENLRAVAVPMADDADNSTRLTRQLWDLLHEIRVVSVRPLLQRLARVARAAAKIEGKQIQVVLEGEDAPLDRLVQDRVFEPLLHVVRNAVGHGIEQAIDRAKAGKDPVGKITLKAVQEEDTLILTVEDDGSGLDYASIERKARELGLLSDDEHADVERLQEMVFRPGFSTRAGADALSGRGVGMDIVSSEVARLQGTVLLRSEARRGTGVTVRLPARISLEQAMVVRMDGQSFAFPLKSIDCESTLDGTAITRVKDAGRGEPLSARSVLGLPPEPPGMARISLPMFIGREVREVLVDKIEGPRELVVRPLNPLLAEHPIISGTSLASDGELILMLNPNRLAAENLRAPAVSVGPAAAVLVVDDSISVRRSLVRHLKALGLEVEEAGDGVEAWKKFRERIYCLVITDLDMPRMDGFQLLAELAKDSLGSSTPVIVSSARSDERTRRRVLQLGARALLAKPVGMEKLAEVIGPLLSVAV